MNSVKKTSFGIKTKLLVLVGFAMLALVALATYSIINVGTLSETISYLGNQRIPISVRVGELRTGSNAVPRYMWLALNQAPNSEDRSKSLEKVREYTKGLSVAAEDIGKFKITDKAREQLGVISKLLPKLEEVIDQGVKKLAAGDDVNARTLLMSQMPPAAIAVTDAVNAMNETLMNFNKKIVAEAEAQASTGKQILTIFSFCLSLFFGIFAYVFASRLAKTLTQVAKTIGDSSKQVAAASQQVSSASHQLSSTSSEQASAAEETSTSLQEINGMVESNVRSAENAVQVVENVKSVVEKSSETMDNLNKAMAEVIASNKRIEQLVKVIGEIGEKTEIIDEIVFQTKLLSFNASVEAERAGEHGRGFAVVAQEVGNLAQMSGKAALEISSIVKSSTKEAQEIATENRNKVEKGNEFVQDTAEALQDIQKNVETVLTGSRQILSASKEQSAGINQISTAIENINKATQEAASASEETAGAGEELSSQAQHLDTLVAELNHIISGASGNSNQTSAPTPPPKSAEPKANGHNNVEPISKAKRYSGNANGQNFSHVQKMAAGQDMSAPVSNGAAKASDVWNKL